MLCGWLPAAGQPRPGAVAQAMVRALRADAAQPSGTWELDGVGIGLLERVGEQCVQDRYAPAVTADGRYHLWMAGEAFAGGALLDVPGPDYSRTSEFRRALLGRLIERGVDALADLDGEYHVALWDARERELVLANDRYGGLPAYRARSAQGVAFAGGVRGVLVAPGVPADPDPDAIREAVTFGGYRPGERTNLRAVQMLPGASVMTVRDGALTVRRYWHWRDIAPVPPRPMPAIIEELHGRWRRAVGARLAGAARPGQTLSGGLDSRAILAEAAPRAPRWTAITYGIPGCDDARYAERAARAVGATWRFHRLYGGAQPDWLERRSRFIQSTDGLIDLTDLMHLEALELQRETLDVNLSGYIGDAVSGPTFNAVAAPADALIQMPFYGTALGLGWTEALARVDAMAAALDGAPPRFVLFEHKLPQSTNRMPAAWRSWLRVRKPFVDYAFFDLCQGLPPAVRGPGRLHERWLRSRYPACFAWIPNQKTGMPVLTPGFVLQIERARRFAWRLAQPLAARAGIPVRPRRRAYHADEEYWRVPAVRERIEQTVLRPGSIACDVLGREAVGRILSDWFERAAAPAQVIGALYVHEAYHRDLAGHLREARG